MYVLGTLRAYTHWLSEYYSAMMLEPDYSQSQLLQFIVAIAEACEPVLSPGVCSVYVSVCVSVVAGEAAHPVVTSMGTWGNKFPTVLVSLSSVGVVVELWVP